MNTVDPLAVDRARSTPARDPRTAATSPSSARPCTAAAAGPSAPEPSPPSAARRRTACRPAAAAARRTRGTTSSIAPGRAPIARRRCRHVSAHQQVFAHGHGGEQPPRLRHRADAAADDLRRRQAGDLGAVEGHVPERGRNSPRMIFIVVDLPLALPPSRQTI